MDFTSEQLEFILIQMKRSISDAIKLIDKYDFGDEATAGADDAIELALSVIKTISNRK